MRRPLPVPPEGVTVVHLCGNCKATTERPSLYVLPRADARPGYAIVVCPCCTETLRGQTT